MGEGGEYLGEERLRALDIGPFFKQFKYLICQAIFQIGAMSAKPPDWRCLFLNYGSI